MSVFKRMKDEKSKKYKVLRVRVSEETANKIEHICKINPDVKQEEYLGQLIEESEIDKVYKEITNKQNSKKSDAKKNDTVAQTQEELGDDDLKGQDNN